MPTLTTLALFAVATLIITVSPGPGVLYVSARTLSQGRRAGFASAFGIEFGEVVWIAAAATGLTALLATSPSVLTVLRVAGAAYLVYLGIQRWRHAEKFIAPRPAPIGRMFTQGVITQLLNPKVALFAIAFLPPFINPADAVVPQVAILGCVYIAIAILVDTSYVLAASAISRRLLANRNAQKRLGRVAAGTYFALGVAAVAVGERPS